MYFFSMTLPILRRIQRPTTQGHSSHTKYDNSRKIETYRIKPLKEVKKNVSLENSITKKMSTEPSLYYDGFVSYDFPKILFCLMQISSGSILTLKISLENHNWRTRHSTNLFQCSFSSLSNSLETHFFIYFFTSLRGFIRYVSIFRRFSYFVWLEWPYVVGRWIRLEIGNVIEKKIHGST